MLKKYDLITPWERRTWPSFKPERAKHPDERWQVDIMYVKIRERFFYLIIFIDEYSRDIVHHALMTSARCEDHVQGFRSSLRDSSFDFVIAYFRNLL
ncbi:MAG: DDE-type integrase/transposase/recombinase [Thermoplasmata archaeon]